jgi:6-methylsalicylate decarboxylase
MPSTVIDVHSHATFDAGDGLDAGLAIPIGQVPWSPSQSLDLMDEVGIDVAVVSMPSSGIHGDRAFNRTRSRQVNEFLAGLRDDSPTRRGAMAALPVGDMDDSLAELAYALDELQLDAVSVPTSVHDVNLGDPSFDPLFAELDRRSATLFIHPELPPAAERLTLGINQSILEFPFDTTRTITNLILRGTLYRFPNVQIITSHGGGTLPYLITRLQTLIPVFGPGPHGVALTAEQIAADARLLWYDLTAATDPGQLTAITEMVGAERLMMGFDIPYMPSSSMAPALASVRSWDGFDEPERERVLSGNAAALFPTVMARRAAPTA